MRSMEPAAGGEAGFSMLEVLITIVVAAMGLLGMLSVVINSVKLTSSSNYRTIASQQAYAMAEALRANPFLVAPASGTGTSFSSPASTLTSNCLLSAGCATTSFVNSEYYLWRQQLSAVLPGGDGTICRDSTPLSPAFSPSDWQCDGGGEFVVKVCWNESRVAGSASAASGTLRTTAAIMTGGQACTWTSL